MNAVYTPEQSHPLNSYQAATCTTNSQGRQGLRHSGSKTKPANRPMQPSLGYLKFLMPFKYNFFLTIY